MSLGIAFRGPEGIVLAADSRVTLTAQLVTQGAPGPMLLPATFDNATKLIRVSGQDFVGAVTYGAGAIGQQEPRTAHSFVPEFEAELTQGKAKRLSVENFAKKLSEFFMKQWSAVMPTPYTGPDMIFLVGGYDEGAPYGRVFEIYVPNRPAPRETMTEFGCTWGGQREYVDRLLQGFDENAPAMIQQQLGLSDPQREALRDQLKRAFGARIPFQFLPLQDCVDLSIFLIRATIKLHTWLVGVRGVGGAIDVATITRTDGFRSIQQKRVVGEGATYEARVL